MRPSGTTYLSLATWSGRPTTGRVLSRTCLSLLLLLAAVTLSPVPGAAGFPEGEAACLAPATPAPPVSDADVYRDMPFQPGERAVYAVHYMGALAGWSRFEVGAPAISRGSWYRVFRVDAGTGDWYKGIYEGHGHVFSMSRPQDFGARRFLLERSGRRVLSKWKTKKQMLEFSQADCKVIQYLSQTGRPEQVEEQSLPHGAMDILTAAYFIRSHHFQAGKPEQRQLFYDGKYYTLHLDPVGNETVDVPAGRFTALKMEAQTYRDGKRQDKGRFRIWVARDHPSRPVVMVDADVKLGQVTLRLESFEPGAPR